MSLVLRPVYALVFLLVTSAVSGADLSPDDAAIAAAVARGAAMAEPYRGYHIKDHVIYAVPDSLNIDPALGEVDAVALGTPLERARHAGFVAAFTHQKLTVADTRAAIRLPPGWLSVLVYAHGPDAIDTSFTGKFSTAKLVFADRTVIAADAHVSEPSESVYPKATTGRERRTAVITWRFDLSAWPALHGGKARLQFTGPTGRAFDLPVDLGAYR